MVTEEVVTMFRGEFSRDKPSSAEGKR